MDLVGIYSTFVLLPSAQSPYVIVSDFLSFRYTITDTATVSNILGFFTSDFLADLFGANSWTQGNVLLTFGSQGMSILLTNILS